MSARLRRHPPFGLMLATLAIWSGVGHAQTRRPMTETDLPRGASAAVWSPDGRAIAFSSTTTEDDRRKRDQPQPAQRESDVRVITRATYRFNGKGYLDPDRRAHIWTIPVPRELSEKPEPRQITTGRFDEENATWGPDGTRLYFTSNRVDEPSHAPNDDNLYSVPAGGGEPTLVASIDGPIGTFAFSPDGQRIAFVGALNGKPVRSYSQSDMFVTSATAGGSPRNLTAAYDFDIDGGIGGDQRAPRGSLPSDLVWTRDGRSLVIAAAEHGSANLKRIDAETGTVEDVTRGSQDVQAYTATADGTRLALLISTPTNVGDLFVLNTTGGSTSKPARLTDVNRELFGQLAQSEPEEIWYSSFDGRRIQGWILKPPDFDASKKYPFMV